jgi:hypothetical protein
LNYAVLEDLDSGYTRKNNRKKFRPIKNLTAVVVEKSNEVLKFVNALQIIKNQFNAIKRELP